jgi:hypothetical protein
MKTIETFQRQERDVIGLKTTLNDNQRNIDGMVSKKDKSH